MKLNCFFVLLFYFYGLSASPSICLNMIVKNETPVIERCLASVKPIIDYWVIVDTGSSDGTQDLIRHFMQDIPGELHESSWVNFEHNRNEALALAKNKSDYILFIDADEFLSFSDTFKLPSLDKDFYFMPIEFNGTNYNRVSLINNRLDWKWVGVLHECIICPEARSFSTLNGVKNIVYTDGNRSSDPLKYVKDAAVLEKALIDEPDNKRYQFYLAQSYKDAGNYKQALKNYQKRIAMKGWQEEVFWSMLQIGILQEELKYPTDLVLDSYYKAYLYRSTRAEPLYRIANLHRRNQNYSAGYEMAAKGLMLEKANDSLFIEQWIYDYGLLLEFSICAYWTEKYHEALFASLLILANEKTPGHIRECVEQNLIWIRSKLQS